MVQVSYKEKVVFFSFTDIFFLYILDQLELDSEDSDSDYEDGISLSGIREMLLKKQADTPGKKAATPDIPELPSKKQKTVVQTFNWTKDDLTIPNQNEKIVPASNEELLSPLEYFTFFFLLR